MLLSTVLFALMGACTKALTIRQAGVVPISGGEVAFFRYLAGFVAMLAAKPLFSLHLLGTDRRGLIWRGVSGGFATTLFFFGIQMTTLTHATLLNLGFVIWGPLIATVVLKEALGMKGMIAVVIAILGVVLVTDPNLLLAPGAQRGNMGDLLSLVSGVLAGFAVVVIRQLRQGETSYSIFFYFNLVGLPVALLVMAVTHTPFLVPTLAQSLWLLLMGAASVGAQLLMTHGFRDLTAAEGSLISLTSIIYSALISWAVFQEAITLYTAIGGALILFASWLMTRSK